LELVQTLVYTRTPLWVVLDTIYRCVHIYKTTSPTSGESFVSKSINTKSLQELRTVSVNTWCGTLIEPDSWASRLDRNKRRRKTEDENGPTHPQTNTTGQPDFHATLLKFQLVQAVKPVASLPKPSTNSVREH